MELLLHSLNITKLKGQEGWGDRSQASYEANSLQTTSAHVAV